MNIACICRDCSWYSAGICWVDNVATERDPWYGCTRFVLDIPDGTVACSSTEMNDTYTTGTKENSNESS